MKITINSYKSHKMIAAAVAQLITQIQAADVDGPEHQCVKAATSNIGRSRTATYSFANGGFMRVFKTIHGFRFLQSDLDRWVREGRKTVTL